MIPNSFDRPARVQRGGSARAALDELQAYLRSAPKAPCPDKVDVLVVMTGAPTARQRWLGPGPSTLGTVRPRQRGRRQGRRPSCACWSSRTRARAPRCGPECWPRPVISSCRKTRHGHAPDQLPNWSTRSQARTSVLGSRIQPDGSDMRHAAALSTARGKPLRLAARIWVTGPIDDTQCGFKGSGATRHGSLRQLRITSIVFDVDCLPGPAAGYRMAVVPVVWVDRRGSRMHAARARAACGWDLLRNSSFTRPEASSRRGRRRNERAAMTAR